MKIRSLMGLALIAGLAGLSLSNVSAADDKEVSIEDVMKKSFGKKGLKKTLDTAAKADPIKWDDVAKPAKDFGDLSAALGKNKVPKGDAASWEKLTKAFAETGKKISDAAEKKDATALKDALKALGASCMPCHKEHKG